MGSSQVMKHMATVALKSDCASRALDAGGASEVTPCAHSLFQQPWWLDAVAPGVWDAVVVVKNDEIVGRLPFMRKRRFGLTILTQPPLIPFLGPWVQAVAGKDHTRLAREHEILTSLIDALPPHDVFIQCFHHSITNNISFHWCGFTSSILYTYVLDELKDHEKIWAGFRENVRREIRKAERQLTVRPFLALHRMTYDRQGMSLPYSSDLMRRLDAACSARGARRIFVAEGLDGAPHAVLYLVWDCASAYYLMSGSDSRRRTSGAMSLLVWEAIKYAGQVTQRWDFGGSMLQPIERFFRAFGARQVRYARITRGATLRGRLAMLAHELHHSNRHGSP
jgi:lipid II:glycine glycyltransferase (peptidoglycan interpeptide bridge formation enzyme)